MLIQKRSLVKYNARSGPSKPLTLPMALLAITAIPGWISSPDKEGWIRLAKRNVLFQVKSVEAMAYSCGPNGEAKLGGDLESNVNSKYHEARTSKANINKTI